MGRKQFYYIHDENGGLIRKISPLEVQLRQWDKYIGPIPLVRLVLRMGGAK